MHFNTGDLHCSSNLVDELHQLVGITDLYSLMMVTHFKVFNFLQNEVYLRNEKLSAASLRRMASIFLNFSIDSFIQIVINFWLLTCK